MALQHLRLKLSENALDYLGELTEADKFENVAGIPDTASGWAFKALRDIGGQWTARWNLLEVHGKVAVDQAGQIVIETKDVPELPLGDGDRDSNLDVAFGDKVLERVRRAACLNAAIRVKNNQPNPWPTVSDWAQAYLGDAIAIAHAALEQREEASEVDAMKQAQQLEQERLKRRAIVLHEMPADAPPSP